MPEHHQKGAYGIRLVVVVLMSLILAGCGSGSSVATYSVSGRIIRASDSSGLDGITLQFSGGFGTAATAGGGYWRKDGLKGTVTITPVGQGWTFAPANRTISGAASDMNFEASPVGTHAYSVSGYVRDGLGNAVKDVLIELDKGFGSVRTGPDGKWAKDDLSGTVMATPKKDGWAFSPISRTVDGPASNVDFAGTYRVDGLVSDANGTPVGSVRLDFSGGHSSVHTGSDGRWTKTGLSGQVTITPQASGYTFAPESVNVNSPMTGVDFVAIAASSEYSVSGLVADQGGTGIADVLVFLGGGFGTARTSSDGRWSATGLSGDVTVTPAKAGLVFTPETVTVSGWSSGINFTGSPVTDTYSVSGRVTDDDLGVGMYGVSFTFSGGFGRAQTDALGDWSKAGLYGTVAITPSLPGWTFEPMSRTVTGADNAVDFVGSRSGGSASEGGDK